MSVFPHDGKRGRTYWYEFQWRGGTYRKKGFPTEKLAEKAERDARDFLEKHPEEAFYGTVGTRPVPWEEALQRHAEAVKGRRSEKMILARLEWWATWAKSHGARHIQALTPELVETGLKHLATSPGFGKACWRTKRSAQTQKHYLRQLSALYKRAIDKWGVLTRNPVKALDPIHVRIYKPRILPPSERQALIRAAPDPMIRRIIVFGLYTGMREMAIMNLTGEDLRIEPGKIRAWDRKPGEEPEPYFIPILPEVAQVIRELGVVSGPLWRKAEGGRQRAFPRRAWLRTLAAAGYTEKVPRVREPRPAGTPGPKPFDYRVRPTLRFHDLRHMVGVTLAEAGVQESVIQAFMHHATSYASKIYTRWVTDRALVEAGVKLTKGHAHLN